MSRPDGSPIDASPAPDLVSLGWREWVALPALGIGAIKAKLDSGARSSSLHVEGIETFREGGVLRVRFLVRVRRRSQRRVACAATVQDRRHVTDSGGHRSERWFIATQIEIAGRRIDMEMNLTDRGAMLFPLLLGRSTIGGHFRIDPALSYTCPRPTRAPFGPSPPLPA
ncbi:ATP-dependent zinc protease [Dokdonella sp.]|uniref:ATP-dependent zinc protease family protein n=1 Tax=Dokdonella sp. TaxID=2291710 RepID=UPI002F3F8F7B